MYTITTRQIVGSSPRVWGQVKVINMRGSKRRIIPTRVGTRFFLSVCIIPQEDHPHACGDKRSVFSCKVSVFKSSPRVWGQAYQAPRKHWYNRIIPTRVGTRYTVLPVTVSVKDHPHAYGDKNYFDNNSSSTNKSSPSVWGQV